jgi:hypothetical protein
MRSLMSAIGALALTAAFAQAEPAEAPAAKTVSMSSGDGARPLRRAASSTLRDGRSRDAAADEPSAAMPPAKDPSRLPENPRDDWTWASNPRSS